MSRDIKPTVCRKAACVAARRPLLLAMRTEEVDDALLALPEPPAIVEAKWDGRQDRYTR